MATQDQPHENLIFPEEVLPRGNSLQWNFSLSSAGRRTYLKWPIYTGEAYVLTRIGLLPTLANAGWGVDHWGEVIDTFPYFVSGEVILEELMRFWDLRVPWLEPLRGPNGILLLHRSFLARGKGSLRAAGILKGDRDFEHISFHDPSN
ncbi:hypothetical protein HAX54_047727 [Datura stramonium]|uniref:Uncharacterized protein n=1 Tax=Datura stramonium TaxID=4076 RepID=A0ABS8WKM1_DATST|nr:hypothetical protein [Datura stramonium]